MTYELRIEITPATIWRLIRKHVLKRGHLDFRIECDWRTGEWFVSRSGWKPLDVLRADSPATLLRVMALTLDGPEEPRQLEPPGDRLPPPD